MNINEPSQLRGVIAPFLTPAVDVNVPRELRLPIIRRLPDVYRNHFIAMCGEYVGTVLFLYFALAGTQVANNIPSSSGLTVAQTGSNPQQLQYIALSFGFSLAVNAWVFFRISGGLFNPAVTFGMCLIGALPWVRGTLLFGVQIIGGITAAALVSCMFPGPLKVQTTLGGNTSIAQGLFVEMFLTAELVFTIFMLAAEKHKGTFIAPVGIGLSLFVAELTGVYFTGGSLNPARSFGPAVINRSFEGYHWIYWLGPILGSIVAAGFYKFIKMLEYETANPDQDAMQAEMRAQAKVLEAHQAQVHHLRSRSGSGSSGLSLDGGTVVASDSHERSGSRGAATAAHAAAPAHGTADASSLGVPPTPVNSNVTGNGGGVQPLSVLGGGLGAAGHRPFAEGVLRESPAMATNNDAFYGLAHGMHGWDRNGDYMAQRLRPVRTESCGV